ncbi:DUF3606 domain-containing protein [Clostridium akagii]|uniref:DUF3606 domain-containing protein n=1 Tax=Clostridium akagii TaxID=91623 RepID=UPI000478FA5D|nr:DUF3606 domain-containing protein [Clostridium akagii]
MLLFRKKTYDKASSNYIKIDIFDGEELKFWCKKFNCTEDELIYVVNRVGISANKVEEYFIEN